MSYEKSNWVVRAFAVDKEGKRFAVVAKINEDYLAEVYEQGYNFIEDTLGLTIASWHIELVGTAFMSESYGLNEFKMYTHNWNAKEINDDKVAFWDHFKPEGK